MKQINPEQAMQNIGETSETSLSEKQQKRQLNLAKAIFQKFRAIFPQKFDQQFPSEEIIKLNMAEWADCIADIPEDRLAIGIESVRNKCEWPPSIAQFRELCLEAKNNSCRTHNGPAYKALPKADKLEENKEMVNEARNDLKKKLGIPCGGANELKEKLK